MLVVFGQVQVGGEGEESVVSELSWESNVLCFQCLVVGTPPSPSPYSPSDALLLVLHVVESALPPRELRGA